MITSNHSKRQKTSSSQGGIRISDIPDEALAAIAQFLTKPTQALFAVAITAPSPSWRESELTTKVQLEQQMPPSPPSSACQAILSLNPSPHNLTKHRDDANKKWATLDFAYIEPSLTKKLSDDDIAAVLVCINAVNKLESLKLTGCVNIAGHGLNPLRGSTVLKQLDLSLVGQHESPNIGSADDGPLLSEDVVIPILESIIDNEETSSLKQLQLPKKFRSIGCSNINKPMTSQLVDDFILKYDSFLEHFGGTCTKCKGDDAYWGNENINGIPWFIDDEESPFYGLQNFTCYICTQHFCHTGTCVGRCVECEKVYCNDCVTMEAETCRECWEGKKSAC